MNETLQAIREETEAQWERDLREIRFIYLMKCHKFYKIGTTWNVEKRLKGVQVGNPYQVELVAICKTNRVNARRVEIGLHHYLKKHGFHTRGEWFELSDKLVSDLKDSFKKYSKETGDGNQ